MQRIQKLLVANRGEIAIRVMRAAAELEIESVAIYSQEDRFSLHRFKGDEAYLVGKGKTPVQAYLDAEDIIRIGLEAGVDAIHPGYGFLSERPEFAEGCAEAGIIFIGPPPDVMRTLGNKVAARRLAERCGVAVMPVRCLRRGCRRKGALACRPRSAASRHRCRGGRCNRHPSPR